MRISARGFSNVWKAWEVQCIHADEEMQKTGVRRRMRMNIGIISAEGSTKLRRFDFADYTLPKLMKATIRKKQD